MTVVFSETSPADPAAQRLIRELDSELLERYPSDSVHALGPEDTNDFRGVFLLAWSGSNPIGCGAIRILEPGVGELKRMYVRRSARREGLGRALLRELETAAQKLGLSEVRLETGELQPEAQSLYESAGYVRIAPFGEYIHDPYSLCYAKAIPSSGAA